MSFEGKVVLITGAGSGIGADVARHLAKLGAKVAVVDRNKKGLNQVIQEIQKSGAQTPFAIVADITKDAEHIVNQTIEHFKQLDILVNNAGIAHSDQIETLDISMFDHVFNTNVRSVIILTKLSVPHLEKTKGNIVNVSSLAGMRVPTNGTSYAVSKAAVDHFTRCCALELAPKGIRVNTINPAVVKTALYETGGLSSREAEQYLNQYKAIYPLGRPGEVSDTSAAIAFLADNKLASFLTGISLPVDGGSLLDGRVYISPK